MQPVSRRVCSLFLVLGLGMPFVLARTATGDDLDADPLNYRTAPTANVITRLQARLEAGQARLEYDNEFGYLRSVLRELQVPESSQMLVFTKTSLQRHRISPKTPRALYFNDDVYVGFCRQGDVMEISAPDPVLGTVFYTLEQNREEKPRFVRQHDSCLLCHGSSVTQGYPGHLVRSVFADGQGLPLLSSSTYRTDQTSPLKQRWGGWYVTGTSGSQFHMGNRIVRGRRAPENEDNVEGSNVTDLRDRFTVGMYPTPHSDLVALMVMEHQAEMHNRIARATLETRIALYQEADINKALGRPEGYRSESTTSRLRYVGEPVVKYLFFSEEAQLTEPVRGTSAFADEFPRRGPRDAKGRSLRDLDLQCRLFKHPCSYLVYSDVFDAMPTPVREYVLRRMWEVLTGKDQSKPFAHLTPQDRTAILEILRATKPNLPDYWREPTATR